MDAREVLAASPLFGPPNEDSYRRLAGRLIERRLDTDATVYLRGDDAEALYGIGSGRVRFSAVSPEGKELVLDYAGEGQWFGEIGLFDGGPRIVDAHAADKTTLWVLPRRDLLDLCSRDAPLALRFIDLFSARLRVAEEIVADAAFLTLPTRLAKRLLALASVPGRAETGGGHPCVRISQDELGRLTGVTRESVGRQLKLWQNEGLVSLEYGRIELLRTAELERLVRTATER